MAKKKAGEAGSPAAPVAAKPIDEAKALKLIKGMNPEIQGDTLQNVLVNLLTEHDRAKRKLAEVPVVKEGQPVSDSSAILAGIKRIEESLNNVKMQFSTMRQYGVGMSGGK